MTDWIRTDYYFDDHRAVFYLTRRGSLMAVADGLLGACKESPDTLEAIATDLIARFRPALAGHVLLSMRFDPKIARWEFHVSHASLAAVRCGEMPPEFPIDPGDEIQ